MEIKQLVRHLVAVACLVPSIASADIIRYSINRTVGSGTVVGFVETNGKVGPLATADLVDWELTLTASNLWPGSPEVIGKSKGNSQSSKIVGQSVVVASESKLSFDFSSPSSGMLFLTSENGEKQGNNYWCLSVGGITCNGEITPAETIGFNDQGFLAQAQPMTGQGRVIIGLVDPVPVPEPASLALVGFGLAGLGLTRRRKQQIA